MMIVAQHFTAERVQEAFDEAAEYRGREWALNRLEECVGVRNVDDVPKHKYMNGVAAFFGYTIGVPKPTTKQRIICKSSKRPQSTLNEMAAAIFSRKEASDG